MTGGPSDARQRFLERLAQPARERLAKLERGETQLWHYTSYATAMKIIENREVWLRNARLMNDFSEIEHAHRMISAASANVETKPRLERILERAGMSVEEFLDDIMQPHAESQFWRTYITCLSEHDQSEYRHGRLSMWRAYGGQANVALVFSPNAFLSESVHLGAFSLPVTYVDGHSLINSFGKLIAPWEAGLEACRDLDGATLRDIIKLVMPMMALSIKHPAFSEEREWRVFYCEGSPSQGLLQKSVEAPTGTPEIVYKIPLENRDELDLNGLAPDDLIAQIVIGPTEAPDMFREALIDQLREAGFNQPEKKVRWCGVPLRR